MHLEIASFPVKEVVLRDRTEYRDGVLHLDQEGLESWLARDPHIRSVKLDLAYPGEETRVVHVLDVMEARCKPDHPGAAFPGILGPPDTAGEGRTNRLSGLAIVQSAQFSQPEGLRMLREGIIDLSGPAAELVPFSSLINLVVQFEPEPSTSNAEYDHAMRVACVDLAEVLARTSVGQEPADVHTYTVAPRREELPRVVWICLVQSFGTLEQTLLYGESTKDKLPVVMHPNEVLDGGVVSGNFMFPCQRNRTYLYQNNPLLEELYALDGRDLSLAGVVISPSMRHTVPDKERIAAAAANSARLLGADAAIVTQEGGGHGAVDFMLVCDRCERIGIKTVLVNNEPSDAEGTDTSFVFVVPGADAMISTGKTEELIELPAMERVIGGEMLEFEEVRQPAGERFVTSLRPLCCATSQIGATRLSVQQY